MNHIYIINYYYWGLILNTQKINTLSAIYINSIRPEHKFYAIRIMDFLYTECANGMTLNEIYDMFDGDHIKTINNTVEELRERLLIEQLNIPDNYNETSYNLSEYGRYKITQFYNSKAIYF